MTKRKKIIVIVSISFFVLVASGFSLVMITGACGPGSGFGQRFHKRGIPPFMQKEIGSFILWRMDKGIKTLDLSKIQQKQYNNFRSRLEETMGNGLKTKIEFKKQALLEFDKEAPDLAVITGKIQADIEFMADSLSKNLALFTDFYNSLNDEQKGTITKNIKERIEYYKSANSCYERGI
jgi:hypothetical protein